MIYISLNLADVNFVICSHHNKFYFVSGIASLSQGCVSEYKSALKECMDPLKSAISGQNVDVNDVFCR